MNHTFGRLKFIQREDFLDEIGDIQPEIDDLLGMVRPTPLLSVLTLTQGLQKANSSGKGCWSSN